MILIYNGNVVIILLTLCFLPTNDRTCMKDAQSVFSLFTHFSTKGMARFYALIFLIYALALQIIFSMQSNEPIYNASLFYRWLDDDNLDLLLIFDAQQTRKRLTQNDDDTGSRCNLIGVCFNFKVFPTWYCSYFCISKAGTHFFFSKNINK